jgi:hypothetical protein
LSDTRSDGVDGVELNAEDRQERHGMEGKGKQQFGTAGKDGRGLDRTS